MTPAGASARGFEAAEFGRRLVRAQAVMAQHKFDALLCTTPANIRYFTGFDTQFWESPTRPWFVVVPLGGDPVAVIPEVGASVMARTWVKDIRTWPAPRPDDDGMTLLAAALSGVPRRFGRLGAELGRETSLRMPVMQFLELRSRVPAELADGSPCIWEIRMVKTDAEIERIRRICRIAGGAYEALPGRIHVGDTERNACRRLRAGLVERGADAMPYVAGVSGPGGVPQIISAPGDRRLQEGDLLFIDTGSTYDGYFCDFDRNYAVGEVSSAAKRAQQVVWDATEAGIKAARPGATAENLWRSMAGVLSAGGSRGNNVGRLGHGLGLQLTEPPSNMPGDRTVLRAGMVVTIEPGMEYAPGKMIVHEEDVVITSDGCELLTQRAPRELWTIR
ncbi:MAG TPA: Xaa-Pro peptidase family protein [bacterium]|nr:Xaa-Pro peptidase family protein [bacterium]